MRLRLLALTSLVAMAVSVAVTLGVHAVRGAAHPTPEDPLHGLDLGAGQRHEIEQLIRASHHRLMEKQAAVDAQRARLAELLATSTGADDARVQECLHEVARLSADLDREVVAALARLKPHLTPEQQQQLFHYIELRHPVEEKR